MSGRGPPPSFAVWGWGKTDEPSRIRKKTGLLSMTLYFVTKQHDDDFAACPTKYLVVYYTVLLVVSNNNARLVHNSRTLSMCATVRTVTIVQYTVHIS